MLHDRETNARVFKGEAVTGRAPRRVHLERGNFAGGDVGRHLVESGMQVPDVRGDHVVYEHPSGATMGEIGGELLRAERVAERNRSVSWSAVGHVGKDSHGRVAGQEQIVEGRGPG